MEYRRPTLKDETILKEYVKEHQSLNESVTGGFGIEKEDYGSWLTSIEEMEKGVIEFGRCVLFLCFDENRLVGLLSLRPEISGDYKKKYGHIGYGVRPSERRKGYATKMLQYGLSYMKKEGMKEVLIGCYKDNVASARTIVKNGGQLLYEKDDYTRGRMSQYYRIDLGDSICTK